MHPNCNFIVKKGYDNVSGEYEIVEVFEKEYYKEYEQRQLLINEIKQFDGKVFKMNNVQCKLSNNTIYVGWNKKWDIKTSQTKELAYLRKATLNELQKYLKVIQESDELRSPVLINLIDIKESINKDLQEKEQEYLKEIKIFKQDVNIVFNEIDKLGIYASLNFSNIGKINKLSEEISELNQKLENLKSKAID
jgi:hypothetical protein